MYLIIRQCYNTKYNGMLDESPSQSYNGLLKNSKNENKTDNKQYGSAKKKKQNMGTFFDHRRRD